jgi:putative membrane protein
MNHENHGGGKTILTLFFLIISVAIIHLIVAGQLTQYVHPRYKPFIITAVMLCVLITLILIFTKRTIQRISSVRIAVLLIPVILLIFTTSSAGRYSDLPQRTSSKVISPMTENDDVPESIMQARESAEIVFSDSFSYMVLQDIYDNPQFYKGKKFSMKGIAMKQKKGGDPDEFAIIRMMMTCCSADLQPIGFICQYGKLSLITHSSWYKIDGNITIQEKRGMDIPVVNVLSFSKAEKPEEEYIYPF